MVAIGRVMAALVEMVPDKDDEEPLVFRCRMDTHNMSLLGLPTRFWSPNPLLCRQLARVSEGV